MTERVDTAVGAGPIARFEVAHEVGRGAAGIVFRAVDRQTGAPVALKVIAQADADAEQRAHFLDEGQLLCGIHHPSIVRIVDYGTLGSEPVELAGQRFGPQTPYIAMEWLSGTDLQRRQGGSPLSIHETLECATQVASALDTAHRRGVVHRDIKPSNIFVLDGEPMRVKLVDFGVACASDDIHAMGGMVGTPAYMAPEQARGDVATDPRSDVYSLGATVFELLAGRPPHVGPTPIATLAKVVSTPAPRLSELLLEVPEPLDDLVADMLRMEVDRRPRCPQVIERLGAVIAHPQLPAIVSMADSDRADSAHSSVSRLITMLVALSVGVGDVRQRALQRLRRRGADAVRLGKDAIVAYLGTRRAHGGEAVLALELGRTLAAQGACVGVATGRALVDLRRPVGNVVDSASALARAAAKGQLLADESSAELARSSFDFAAGPDRSWEVGDAIAERGFSREQTPFVGRGNELSQLFRCFDQTRREQRAAVASISGPPGIGKSRLAREFLRRIDEHTSSDPFDVSVTADSWSSMIESPQRLTAPVRVAQARCDAYGRARPLGTAADALVDLLRLPKAAGGKEVAAALAPLRLFHDEQGLLSSLLAGDPFGADVDANRARDILYLAMTELVLKVIEDAPCVIVLEDVQWADAESVAWFDHLLNRAADRSLMLLPLARPSFWKDYPHAFSDNPHTRVELRPIPRRAAMEIARAVMSCDSDDPALAQIAKQAAGSPLFAEELARVFAKGGSTHNVPTIEAAIQVSLDALSDNLKDAIMRMSVFGQTAWDEALGAIGVFDHENIVASLRRADLIVQEQRSRFAGTRELRFKHALVRDVAYASCSDAMRKDLHSQVATWLAGVGEDAATVAEHYDIGDMHQRAAGYWELAARRALTANALVDAVRMADRALIFADNRREAFARAVLLDEVYLRLDERAAERSSAITAMAENAYDEASEVQTMGAQARYDHARSAGYDVDGRLREVVERAAELGLLEEQARSSATLATRAAYAGEQQIAESEAASLLTLSRERGLSWAAIDAWQALAVVRQTGGQLALAFDARRSAAEAARAAGLKQREATLTINLGFALTTIGARDEARAAIEDGIRMATEIGSTGTVRLGSMILLGWAAHFGADPKLDEALAEPRASADEAASGAWMVKDRVTLGVLFYRGCELLRTGGTRLRQARALLKMSAQDYRQTDNRDVLPVALGYWAEAERKLGEVERAEEIASEAADLVEAGAPSLLNEAIIYLALHAARVDRADLRGARGAVERGMAPLLRRVEGLRGTRYAQNFLRLDHNAQLLAAADAFGCVPEAIESLVNGSEYGQT